MKIDYIWFIMVSIAVILLLIAIEFIDMVVTVVRNWRDAKHDD